MNCIIYVFSGTGNTRLVAEEYASFLGSETHIYDISASSIPLPAPDGYDLVGVGYPVHAFNTPEIVERAVSGLMPDERKKLFIFHTGGEGLHFNDTSSNRIRKILSRRFDILSERHYVMPYNMIFRHSDAMAKHMLSYMHRLVPIHVSSLLSGRREKERHRPLSSMISAILRIEWIYARLQGPWMKAGSSCTGCGLCARKCPMGNIDMVNGHPVFGMNCSLCVRCSFSCPADAISIGMLNGWKVNGPYGLGSIMADSSIPDTIPIGELPLLYRKYYREADKAIRDMETGMNRLDPPGSRKDGIGDTEDGICDEWRL